VRLLVKFTVSYIRETLDDIEVQIVLHIENRVSIYANRHIATIFIEKILVFIPTDTIKCRINTHEMSYQG